MRDSDSTIDILKQVDRDTSQHCELYIVLILCAIGFIIIKER